MPLLWSQTAGRVIALEDPSAPAVVRFVSMNPKLDFATQSAIISRTASSDQANFNILHAIGGDIFLYVFGDRAGQLQVSGLSFPEQCNGGESGVDAIANFYRKNKLSVRKEEFEVIIGTTPYRGFLAGIATELANPESRISQFVLQIVTIPEK